MTASSRTTTARSSVSLRPPELAPVATCEVPVRSVADASTLLLKVTQNSSIPNASNAWKQWPAVRNTVGEMSVPEEKRHQLWGIPSSTRSAPTCGCGPPSKLTESDSHVISKP